ncbi:MAG TPA: hypothetical protein VIJ87_20920, partial [Pyrinomonadaceae bacterium]
AFDFRIVTRFDPTLPSAPLEYVGSVGEFGLQWDQLVEHEPLDVLTKIFFLSGKTKLHGVPYVGAGAPSLRQFDC